MYSFDDAVEEVAVKTAVLDKEVSELYALRKENAKLAAELAAIKNQEPVEIDWPDYHHQAMGCGLEDRNIHDRYEAMQYGWDQAIERVAERLPQELFTAPTPPVREPLTDAQINEIRLVHGVTSSGRGIRKVAQVIIFARAIEAAIKEQGE